MVDGTRAACAPLGNAVDQALSGPAKRTRPYLALVSAAMFGHPPNTIATFAASVELLHSAALVHDDLIDGAALRRGRPSLNNFLSPVETVLAGDYMFARAAVLAARTESPPVIELFAEALSSMVASEMSQRRDCNGVASKESYLRRIDGKTATLFALATEGAAILAGAPKPATAALAAYGRHVGMAFQISDDTMDYVSTAGALGKPTLQDLRSGIATMPFYCLASREPECPELQRYLATREHSDDELHALVLAIVNAGAIDESRAEARSYAQRAQDALRGLPDSAFRAELSRFAAYAADRDH
jgi:geranylgeranyl pyrophosphate synthase